MTTEKMIALAKEKLGKDITEQEVQDYLSGKAPFPDEALDLVSGGGDCSFGSFLCPNCNLDSLTYNDITGLCDCYKCRGSFNPRVCERIY